MKSPKCLNRSGPLRKSFSNLDISVDILHQKDGTEKPENVKRKCASVSKLEEPKVEKETPEKSTPLVQRLRNLWSQVRRNFKISYVKKPGFPDEIDCAKAAKSEEIPNNTVEQMSRSDSTSSQFSSAYDDDDDTFKTGKLLTLELLQKRKKM